MAVATRQKERRPSPDQEPPRITRFAPGPAGLPFRKAGHRPSRRTNPAPLAALPPGLEARRPRPERSRRRGAVVASHNRDDHQAGWGLQRLSATLASFTRSRATSAHRPRTRGTAAARRTPHWLRWAGGLGLHERASYQLAWTAPGARLKRGCQLILGLHEVLPSKARSGRRTPPVRRLRSDEPRRPRTVTPSAHPEPCPGDHGGAFLI